MPLFQPDHVSTASPEDEITAVHQFLNRARTWATDREIPKRLARVEAGASAEEAAKLHAWVVWRDFIDHALTELEDGTLDHWFSED